MSKSIEIRTRIDGLPDDWDEHDPANQGASIGMIIAAAVEAKTAHPDAVGTTNIYASVISITDGDPASGTPGVTSTEEFGPFPAAAILPADPTLPSA